MKSKMQFKNFPYQNNESGRTEKKTKKKQNSNIINNNNTITETKIYRGKNRAKIQNMK